MQFTKASIILFLITSLSFSQIMNFLEGTEIVNQLYSTTSFSSAKAA